MNTQKYFLLRYDTECPDAAQMRGFLPKVLEVHTRENIPVTLFCTGQTLEKRKDEFIEFWAEARDNPCIDVQDHSYSHIGIGYEAGRPLKDLREDYEKSFAIHRKVFRKSPIATALCGVADSGARLPGLDFTDKSRAETQMLIERGIKMLPAYVTFAPKGTFCSYKRLGYPEVMGYPSAESDTEWLRKNTPDEALAHMKRVIDNCIKNNSHGAVIFHDWCQWEHGPDKELSLVSDIANYAREQGLKLATMAECYNNKEIWHG